MNTQQVFEQMIPRHASLLAEHGGRPPEPARRQRPRIRLIQSWLRGNKAPHRASPLNQ